MTQQITSSSGPSNKSAIVRVLVVGLYPNEACPRFTMGLARGLINLGYEVYAALPSNLQDKEPWDSLEGLAGKCYVDVSGRGGALGKLAKAGKLLSLKWRFRHGLRINGVRDFDYVIYTFYHRWNKYIDERVRAHNRILFVHDPVMHSDETEKRRRLARRQAQSMDGVVVLTKSFTDIMVRDYEIEASRVHYMPHPLIDQSFGLRKPPPYTCNETDAIEFLFFGRICEYKGIEVLIEAYRRLEAKGDGVHLTIAGNGDFTPYAAGFAALRSATLENRYIEESEIEGLFVRPNCVLVVPYVDATQSGVVSLAFSYGVPVIASDTGGLREQLGDGAVGLLCPPGDADALADAMARVSGDSDLRKRQSEAMVELAKTLGWEAATEMLMGQLRDKGSRA